MNDNALPNFKHLQTNTERSFLIQLRTEVTPILANNIFPHFTDHSVTHSDNLTEIIDAMIDQLQESVKQLNSIELLILYSACYLHDIGMQYKNAGNTIIINDVLRKKNMNQGWDALEIKTRLKLIRDYHPVISAEMVTQSVNAVNPLVGMQIKQKYNPSEIAALCEAHGLKTDSDRYQELTEERSNLRMKLLSGLLRVADILDESRHRALKDKQLTLDLDLESQTHWWRHYYTEDVTFDANERQITIFYDFPPDRKAEYENVIPKLQLPRIENEFRYHHSVFVKHGVNWSLKHRCKTKPHSTVEGMPDQVLTEMVKQLRRMQQRQEVTTRQTLLNTYTEARPFFDRRLKELQAEEGSIDQGKYLRNLSKIAFDLWDIGSKRSACMLLVFQFQKNHHLLESSEQINIGIRLLEMLIEDKNPRLANGWVQNIETLLGVLSALDERRLHGMKTIILWHIQMCAYEQAIIAIERTMKLTSDEKELCILRVQQKEVDFLQSELSRVINL